MGAVRALELSAGDREALERMARSGSEPHRRVVRAGALLALADGASVRSVARVLGSHQDSVRRWRDRFSVLTRKALTNNSFNSIAGLTNTIDI